MSDLILVEVLGFDFGAAKTSKQNKIPQEIKSKNNFFDVLMRKFSTKRFTLTAFPCLVVIFIILQAPKQINAKEIIEFNRDAKNYNAKLQIFDQDRKVTEFMVAIADNKEKQMYGLMNLKNLPQQNGMLFVFNRSEIISMWMKNTKIPLDIIFIDENDAIANIEESTTPYSLDLINSKVKVTRVLEINSGLSMRYGIAQGQKINLITKNVGYFK